MSPASQLLPTHREGRRAAAIGQSLPQDYQPNLTRKGSSTIVRRALHIQVFNTEGRISSIYHSLSFFADVCA